MRSLASLGMRGRENTPTPQLAAGVQLFYSLFSCNFRPDGLPFLRAIGPRAGCSERDKADLNCGGAAVFYGGGKPAEKLGRKALEPKSWHRHCDADKVVSCRSSRHIV